jgi:hypothetical protein
MQENDKGDGPTIVDPPSELVLLMLDRLELVDLLLFRRVQKSYGRAVFEQLLRRTRKAISQEFQEDRISDTARLLIVVVGMHSETGGDNLQNWRKMVMIYEDFMFTTGFEASKWEECVRVLKGMNSEGLREARSKVHAARSELDLPCAYAFSNWIEDIAASVINIVLSDKDEEGLTQKRKEGLTQKRKDWLDNFNYTVNGRLLDIDQIKSKDYHQRMSRWRVRNKRRNFEKIAHEILPASTRPSRSTRSSSLV